MKYFALRGTPAAVCLVLSFSMVSVATAPPKKTPVVLQKASTKAPSLNYPITLTDGKSKIVRTRRELGITAGSNRKLVADLGTLKRALTRITPSFKQDAINAKPFVYKGMVKIDPGIQSRSLDVSTTAARLSKAIASNPGVKTFTVSLDKKPPVLTASRLAGITGVLGTMETVTSANVKRNNNIQIAAESIDGTLLSPGEVFSLNETVGKRTQARGFLTATVFVNAEKVPGVGGGVSQVTGTLFNAAALAGLAIKEVNPHSRPVAYLPVGRDATVAYGESDLKFANNTKAPVFIAYSFSHQRLRATIFGAKTAGRRVSLRPVVQNLGPGKVNAQLYRVIKQNGKVIAKERLFTHQYRWEPENR